MWQVQAPQSVTIVEIETGLAPEAPTIFSDTGLGKESTGQGQGSTRWIGDARGPMFISRGARGERGELLGRNGACDLVLHRTGVVGWCTRVFLLMGAGGGFDGLVGMSFSTGVTGAFNWSNSYARVINAAVLNAGGISSCSLGSGGRWIVL